MPEINHPTSGANGEESPSPGRDGSGPLNQCTGRRRELDPGIAVTTLDGFFTFVSPAWAEMHGYRPEEMLGRHLSMCHTGEQMASYVAPLDDRASQDGQGTGTIEHIDKYGNVFSSYTTVALLQRGHVRQLPHFIRVSRPIIGNTAEGEGEFLVNWLNETGAFILDFDVEGMLRYANQRWLDATGHAPDDIGRLRIDDITLPQHVERWHAILDRLGREGDTQRLIGVFVTRAGAEIVVEGSMTAHTTSTGDTLIRAVLHDITHRHRVEREVRAQRTLAQTLRDIAVLLNSTLDLEQVLDRIMESVGRVVEHDAAILMLAEDGQARVVRASGADNPARMGQTFSMNEVPGLRRMIETGQAAIQSGHNGQVAWLSQQARLQSMLAAPLRLNGRVLGLVVLLAAQPGRYSTPHAERLQLFADHAATALHNALLYDELQHTVSTLHERNADLKAFSHTMAHDLKAPLQVLVGYANLLSTDLKDELPEDIVESLRYIEAYAHKMKSMIDNLLLFSELGSAEVTVEPVDMQIVVSLVLARFYDRIRERGVTVEVTPELPRAMGYSPWLEEVFANLIDNSIKYMGEDNPAPRIIVWGERAGDWARFEIIDNGVGIEEADQQRLFQMFTRFHRHHADGSGLGLSIARRIVEKLGGRIGVESEPGRGTKFWIELPPAG